uniref:Protein osiris 14 n=1 Tax=Stomoxys calcitrans TaxID=35570 RepID=A0A1I8Q161_STOCA
MKVFAIASVCLLVASCARAAPSVQDNKIDTESTFSRAARYLGSCFESEDMTTCLAVKGITALNRAARSQNIELVNGVSFKRDPATNAQRASRAMSENEVYSQLPEDADERTGRLVDMAVESATDFLNTHNLEVKMPAEATQELARALDEGRGKLKKMIGPIALAIGAKVFAIIPLLLGGLALLTTKAIIVAKLAFFLALLVGGSKLFGSKLGGGIGSGYSSGWSGGSTGGWSSGASSSYPYARSMNGAQELAYAGQVNAQ